MTDALTRTRFFFDFRSPYSYLASTQLDDLPGEFDWRPFDVLETMKRVGNVPTTVICKPKQAYARQDLGRWAALYGAQLSPNPGMSGIDGPRLLHAALAARKLGHGEEAARRLFRAMWAGDAPLAASDDVAALPSWRPTPPRRSRPGSSARPASSPKAACCSSATTASTSCAARWRRSPSSSEGTPR